MAEVLAAKYPRDLVAQKVTRLYEDIRGTGTGTSSELPDIWPTWIHTNEDSKTGSIGLTVNFTTNSPVAQREAPDMRIYEIGTDNYETVPGLPRTVEQRVYLTGQEADLIRENANSFIGEPLTTVTAYNVQETMKNVILHKWASDIKDGFSHPHRYIDSSGAMVDTYYNQHVSTDSAWKSSAAWYPSETRADKFLRELKEKQAPAVIRNHRTKCSVRAVGQGASFQDVSPQEIAALHLLRKMVTQDAFRNYLRRGIVSVTGPSGLVYAVVRQNHLVEVYRKGKLLSTLCVYLKDKGMPPTDEVVAKMIIVQCNEHDIWRRANINWKGVPRDMRINVNRNNFEKEHLTQLAVA